MAGRLGVRPPAKKEYKAGWAKPKKKPVIAKTAGPKRRSGAGQKSAGPRGPKPA